MNKLAVLIALFAATSAQAAGLLEQGANATGNPFVREERRPMLMPASSAQTALVPLAPVQSAEALAEKPQDNFDNLRVVSKTETYALIVSAAPGGPGGARSGQRSWLVRNGSELVSNGRMAKVIFDRSGTIGLKSGKGDVAWLADIDPPPAHPQPGPPNETSGTPVSAGVGIGAKGGISGGVGSGFSSATGSAAQPGAPR